MKQFDVYNYIILYIILKKVQKPNSYDNPHIKHTILQN